MKRELGLQPYSVSSADYPFPGGSPFTSITVPATITLTSDRYSSPFKVLGSMETKSLMSLSELRAGPERLNQVLLSAGETEANTKGEMQVDDVPCKLQELTV